MIPCQELADGAKPLALPDARTDPSARGWITGFFGKANSRQKRGPAAGRRRKWSAGRRLSVIANGGDTSPQGVSGGLRKAAQEVSQPPRFPALRSLIGSARQEKGLPGASKIRAMNHGCFLLIPPRLRGGSVRAANRGGAMRDGGTSPPDPPSLFASAGHPPFQERDKEASVAPAAVLLPPDPVYNDGHKVSLRESSAGVF